MRSPKLLRLSIFVVGLSAVFSASVLPQTKQPKPAPRKTITVLGTDDRQSAAPKADVGSDKSIGVTVDSYSLKIDVNSDGTASQTEEISQRFETPESVQAFSHFRQEFNGAMDEFEVSDAYIIGADGTKKPLSPGSIKIQRTAQAEAAPSFSTLMVLEISAEGIKPGEQLHFVKKQRRKKNYFDGKYDCFLYFPAVFKWKSVEIDVSAPVAYPLQIESTDLTGGQMPSVENGVNRWHWSLKDWKPFDRTEIFPDVLTISPKIAITSFKDFDELGRAYWSDAEKKADVTPEIASLADEITKNAKTPAEQAFEIYRWVNKNIRYLSIVLDRGGWVPHSSTEIVENRFGDCKDYSTILNALLKAKNIESYPVLIRSDMGTWFPKIAVPSFFNHAILYIPSLDVFADATAENTRLGVVAETIVGKKALLAGSRVGLITTPADRPDDNQIKSQTDLTLLPDGTLKALSKNTYIGRSEILYRPMFSDASLRSSSDLFVAVIMRFLGQAGTGRIVSVSDQFKVADPFQVELEIQLSDFTSISPKGSFLLPNALNLNNPLMLEALTKTETRISSLPTGSMRFVEEYTVSFPAGVDPSPDYVPFEFSNSVGRFAKRVHVENGRLRIGREFILNKDWLPASEYPAFRDLVAKLVNNYSVDIKYTSKIAAPDRSVAGSGRPPSSPQQQPQDLYEFLMPKKLTIRQVATLENSLTKNPDNLSVHRDLLRYYSSYELRDTSQRIAARVRHYRWFIEHFPEMNEDEVFGPISRLHNDKHEFTELKPVWLAALAKDKTNSRVRMNAFEFMRSFDVAEAEKLMLEGLELDRSNYVFPLRLSEVYSKKSDDLKAESEPERKIRITKQLKYGKIALDLLKTERSSDRTEVRKKLLQGLAQAAFDANDYDSARALATELILDFGQNESSSNYDSAAHIGNIVLGRVALKQKDIAKASEYLLIAIRAPLRKPDSWLPEIDTNLARELLSVGAKDVVLEYLRLCEGLSNLKTEKELFAAQNAALKKWQAEIKAGKVPTFDFYKP